MTRTTRRWLLVLNYVASVNFALGFLYVQTFVSLNTSMNVTELDRAEVINHRALKQSYPELAKNPRHDLGQWVARDEHSAAVIATSAGLAIAVLNIASLHLAGRAAKCETHLQPTRTPEQMP
jgi:hypothetical protein